MLWLLFAKSIVRDESLRKFLQISCCSPRKTWKKIAEEKTQVTEWTVTHTQKSKKYFKDFDKKVVRWVFREFVRRSPELRHCGESRWGWPAVRGMPVPRVPEASRVALSLRSNWASIPSLPSDRVYFRKHAHPTRRKQHKTPRISQAVTSFSKRVESCSPP